MRCIENPIKYDCHNEDLKFCEKCKFPDICTCRYRRKKIEEGRPMEKNNKPSGRIL